MISARLQNKIAGILSGWYTEEWGKTIRLENHILLVKDESIFDEIVFNLREEGLTFTINPSIDGWAGAIEFINV